MHLVFLVLVYALLLSSSSSCCLNFELVLLIDLLSALKKEMALGWIIHSLRAYVLVYFMDANLLSNETARYPNEGQSHGSDKGNSLKNPNEGKCHTEFQMPLHYPRYKKADYDNMEEWKIDMLLTEYGLCFQGTLEEKRSFAIGAFLWPDQL
ncbi:hypothetical protein NE237_000950 [Protea cynaroides]|uniref:DUF7722 domain-containing protein n=1 Tax=Protea cynaroides TaxID=273540 RepID=A0A9Q0KSK0_9MAGN|nr:hypothetical protein NE237_000950 [Protea cynaroides]